MGSNKDDKFYDYDNSKKYLLCGPIIVKSLVIIFNILFIISGILLILFGIWTLNSKQDYVTLLSSILYQTSTYILIIAGFIIILTGLLGILSAWFEKRNILIVFFVILVFIFLIEITAGILAFVYRAQLRQNLKTDLENLIFNEYNQPSFETKSKLFDDLQIKFKCCGATNFLDWKNSKYVLLSSNSSQQFNYVAESCCKTPSNLCGRRLHPSNINIQGCVLALEKYISSHIILLGVVGLSSFLFQSIGIFLTSLLLKRIKQKKCYNALNTSEN